MLNKVGPDLSVLVLTISADNFALGFSGSIFIAFLSSLTNRYYTASQYALFTSIMFLPGIILSGFSGQIIDALGWAKFFLFAASMGIPSILFSLLIVKRAGRSNNFNHKGTHDKVLKYFGHLLTRQRVKSVLKSVHAVKTLHIFQVEIRAASVLFS